MVLVMMVMGVEEVGFDGLDGRWKLRWRQSLENVRAHFLLPRFFLTRPLRKERQSHLGTPDKRASSSQCLRHTECESANVRTEEIALMTAQSAPFLKCLAVNYRRQALQIRHDQKIILSRRKACS